MRNRIKKIISTVLCAGLVAGLAGGCSGTGDINGGKRIIRVALSQSETHPEYTGMEKFKEVVEEKLEINMKFRFIQTSSLVDRQKQSS